MSSVPDVCNRVLGLGECVDVDGGKGKLLNVKLRTLGQQTLDMSSNITYMIPVKRVTKGQETFHKPIPKENNNNKKVGPETPNLKGLRIAKMICFSSHPN